MAEADLMLTILRDIQSRVARQEEKLDSLVRRMSTNEEAVVNAQRSVDDLGVWLDDLMKAANVSRETESRERRR